MPIRYPNTLAVRSKSTIYTSPIVPFHQPVNLGIYKPSQAWNIKASQPGDPQGADGYCTILYYTILYYTVLYCTRLYYTVPYYIIL